MCIYTHMIYIYIYIYIFIMCVLACPELQTMPQLIFDAVVRMGVACCLFNFESHPVIYYASKAP